MTDSCCDLSGSYAQEHGLIILPLSYSFQGTQHPDDHGISIPFAQFYNALSAGESSTTSQLNAEDFMSAWVPYLKDGKDVLYIAFSSALSGTCNSAYLAQRQLAEEYPDRRILVVDSLCASLGLGLLVDYARKQWQSGTDIAQIAAWVEENKLNVCHWFTVSDLNHLRRGGRVSGASAFLGTILDIKPILHVDDEGRLIPQEKVKGRKKSLRALLDHMAQTVVAPAEQPIFISHGHCIEDATFLAELIRERFGCNDITLGHIGPVVGSHSGPGTVALFYMGSSRN